jgi:hypothetical protein
MKHDKQTDCLIIPMSEVESVTRNGKPVADHTNAWDLNHGNITIKTKGNDEPTRKDRISPAKNV